METEIIGFTAVSSIGMPDFHLEDIGQVHDNANAEVTTVS